MVMRQGQILCVAAMIGAAALLIHADPAWAQSSGVTGAVKLNFVEERWGKAIRLIYPLIPTLFTIGVGLRGIYLIFKKGEPWDSYIPYFLLAFIALNVSVFVSLATGGSQDIPVSAILGQ